MTWNYRMMRVRTGEHVVVETYDDDAGKLNGWTDRVAPMGETPEELAQNLELMMLARKHPVLVLHELERTSTARRQPLGGPRSAHGRQLLRALFRNGNPADGHDAVAPG